jgi:HEAT repeat protein
MNGDFRDRLQAIVGKLSPEFRPQGQRDIDSVLQASVNSYDDLLAILGDQSARLELRATISWVLGRLGDQRATSHLVEALKDQAPELRTAAVRSLGELGEEQAVQPLIAAMLEDEDSRVRLSAAYSLGLLGDKAAVEPLLAKLGDPSEDPKVRGMAAEALADLRDQRAVEPLIAALRDASVDVRYWAAFALGELGADGALPDLERLATTDEGILPGWGPVKEEAASAIQRIHEKRRNP